MKSVLIFRRGSIGDAVVSIPALNAIAKTHPDAERWILTNMPVMETAAAIQDVLHNSTLVHGFINLPRGGGGWAELRAAIGRMRALAATELYYLSEPSGPLARLKERAFFRIGGIRSVIGAPDAPDTVAYRPLADGLWESETRRLLRAIGADPDAEDWTFPFADTEQAHAQKLLADWPGRRRYVVFSIGAKLPDKDWGDANWTKVLDRVSRSVPDLGLVAIGAADESARTQRVVAAWHGPTLNLCGRTDPRTSALIAEPAQFYLGHDSGPMHLAALVGCRCVAVFSARAKPGVWFPRGQNNRIFYPWEYESSAPARTGFRVAGNSIAAIAPEPVAAACLDLLASPGPA